MSTHNPGPGITRRMVVPAVLLGILGLALSGCGAPDRAEAGAGARITQEALAAILADPARCPTTGTSADLQALVNNPGPDGISRIPAGCYRVTTAVVIPEGVTVIGAGMDQTILYRDPGGWAGRDGAILTSSGREGGGPRISGLAFLGVRESGDTGEDYGLRLSGNRDFRIDHCYFEGFGFAAVRIEGEARGVVDHSLFVDNYKEGIGNLGYGVAVYGDNRWAGDPQPGSGEAVFVEDNTFLGSRHAIAASGGAHYVFRYNLVRENVEACSVDAHGAGYGLPHGTRYVEIYGNTIEDPAGRWCGIGIRGGAGVIFQNTIRDFENPILLVLEWGMSEQQKAEYPAKDQIQDLWIWDNEIAGGPAAPRIDDEGRGFIQEGRDYFLQPKPGYVPYDYPHPLALPEIEPEE